MEFLKKAVLVLLSVSFFTFCGFKHQKQKNFTKEIAQLYYKAVADDSAPRAIRINFYIEFMEPLSEEIRLQKVHFKNQAAEIKKESDKRYSAYFTETEVMQDFILDSDSKKEYGNNVPIIIKPKFKLKKDEAILEYSKNNKTFFLKLTGIIEKQ
jgi:hypothetical protein